MGVVLRFDVVLTSCAMPPFTEASLAFTHILYTMRDRPAAWKNFGNVHDIFQWIPKQLFHQFFDVALGKYGCFERTAHWYGGSGHGCWQNQRGATSGRLASHGIPQGFLHEG